MNPRTTLICAVVILTASACSTSTESSDSSSANTADTVAETATETSFSATVGEPVAGYRSIVDLAVRRTGDAATTYAVEQNGTIRLVGEDGRPGTEVADLSSLTEEDGEQGLLGLAFSLDGNTAYVNYTDLDGNTTVDSISVNADGTFDLASRETIYQLDQPYRNHNGGDLILSPDGRYLFVFNGDGGSADDPDRYALDSSSQLGKIVRIDLEERGETAATIWASGLRNPWRAYLDPETDDLWIADVGQNEWEEINVVPFEESEGVSFGWSALEGTVPFNDDQLEAHQAYTEVSPIHTYSHENDDCSISGGAVYRGSSIPSVGTWYVFSDFCSGNVRALCVTEERKPCGVVSLGTVPSSVAVLPDAQGELWVVSLAGQLVPIVPAT
ncbi:MAG: PQQ-dependent sugar dehydrogenase [Actinomycetota bacterium]